MKLITLFIPNAENAHLHLTSDYVFDKRTADSMERLIKADPVALLKAIRNAFYVHDDLIDIWLPLFYLVASQVKAQAASIRRRQPARQRRTARRSGHVAA